MVLAVLPMLYSSPKINTIVLMLAIQEVPYVEMANVCHFPMITNLKAKYNLIGLLRLGVILSWVGSMGDST